MRHAHRVAQWLCLCALLTPDVSWAGTSALWGTSGELWDSRGRLPDNSWAGYQRGEAEFYDPPTVLYAADFGAYPDDGIDDTYAIQQALNAADHAAVQLEAGTYNLSAPLFINKSHTVLRGVSPWTNGTYLSIGVSLSHVYGFSKSYGWTYGGFIWFRPPDNTPAPAQITTVNEHAWRGDRTLTVADAGELSEGMYVYLRLEEDEDFTLRKHLHGEQLDSWAQPNSSGNATCDGTSNEKKINENFPVQIERILGKRVTLVQPLRFDVRPEWNPQIMTNHYIEEVGVENVRINFPYEPLMVKNENAENPEFISANTTNKLLYCASESGPVCHHHELGYNGVYFQQVHHGWAKRVAVVSGDTGITVSKWSAWITVEDPKLYGRRGHHGVTFSHAHNCLETGHYTSTDWIHFVTFTHLASGNVVKDFESPFQTIHVDHHRNGPHENLVSDLLDAANFNSGGSKCFGPHAGARNTYWGWSSPIPTPNWSDYQNNLVGDLSDSSNTTSSGEWLEQVDNLQPIDLHASQLDRRLNQPPLTLFSPTSKVGDRSMWEERDPSRWEVTEVGNIYRYEITFGDYENLSGKRLGEYSLLPTTLQGNTSIAMWAKTGENMLQNDYADYALIVGYQDDENYYYGIFNQKPNSTQIFRVEDGERVALTFGSTLGISDYVYHWVEFRRVGDTLELLYDDEVVASAVDTTFLTGRVGMGSYNDRARFDDVKVTCPTDCESVQCGDDGCGGTCGDCDDNNACNTDACLSGTCIHLSSVDPCSDGDPCTVDACEPLVGCVFTPVLMCCGDGMCEPGENCQGCESDCGPCPSCATPPGDVNGIDGADILDLQCVIVTILLQLSDPDSLPPACLGGGFEVADINCDTELNVSDALLQIQMILGNALHPLLDADQDGCPDACSAP